MSSKEVGLAKKTCQKKGLPGPLTTSLDILHRCYRSGANLPSLPQISESLPLGNRRLRSARVNAVFGVAALETALIASSFVKTVSSRGQAKVAEESTISLSPSFSSMAATSSRHRYFSMRLQETKPCRACIKVSGLK